MKSRRLIITQIFFVLSLFLISSNFAQAETTECTVITSVPYTITTQGIYCLTSDLGTNMTSGSAITINTSNVVIDLNGHKLGGLAAGLGTTAYGIHVNQQKNITIRNGTVRGFYIGIYFFDVSPYTTSQGHLIEDIRADMNTWVGMLIQGRGNIIRNNQVVGTSGSTISNNPYGISANGPGVRVLNNDVIETKEQSTATANAIGLLDAPGAVVENNRIGNSALGTGISCGINVKSSTDVLVSNNRVTTMNYGVYYYGSATGKYRDNLTSGCTTPFTPGGATDAGGNN